MSATVENLEIRGMHCASCAGNVSRALCALPGVSEANVNLATERVRVEFDPGQVQPQALAEAVAAAGFELILPSGPVDTGNPQPETARGAARDRTRLLEAQGRLFFAWLFTLPIMLIMAGSWAFGSPWPSPLLHRLLMLLLAFPVLFVVGGETLGYALGAVRRRSANMDLLIALGTLAAYSTGFLSLFLPLASFAGVAAIAENGAESAVTFAGLPPRQ